MASSMTLLVDLVILADVNVVMAQMIEAIVLAQASVVVDAAVVPGSYGR